ncbi:MAG: hypothetical protein AAGJ51_03335, partial [Pseudomonadota bacterium]
PDNGDIRTVWDAHRQTVIPAAAVTAFCAASLWQIISPPTPNAVTAAAGMKRINMEHPATGRR